MTSCDDLRAAALRGDAAPARAAHLASCAFCSEEAGGVAALTKALAASPLPEPSPELMARVLAAAAPVVEAHARAAALAGARVDVRRLARALAPALVVLPVLVALDLALLRGAYDLLATLLPRALTAYLVASYAILLAALAGLTFGAIPLLVQRQSARSWKEGHV